MSAQLGHYLDMQRFSNYYSLKSPDQLILLYLRCPFDQAQKVKFVSKICKCTMKTVFRYALCNFLAQDHGLELDPQYTDNLTCTQRLNVEEALEYVLFDRSVQLNRPYSHLFTTAIHYYLNRFWPQLQRTFKLIPASELSSLTKTFASKPLTPDALHHFYELYESILFWGPTRASYNAQEFFEFVLNDDRIDQLLGGSVYVKTS